MHRTAGTDRNPSSAPASGNASRAALEATERRRRAVRTAARHVATVVVHVAGLVSLHSAAVFVIEKTPLLATLSLH